MNTLAKQMRFERVIEPPYRRYMNSLAKAGQIARSQRMARRLARVDDARHKSCVDHPGLPPAPL
jgi:hypothetical protein